MPIAFASTVATVALAIFAGAPAHAASVIVKYRPGRASTRRAGLLRRLRVGRTIGTVRGQGARVMRVTGDPAAILFGPHDEVALVYGTPQPGQNIPAKYDFPAGD